MGIVLEFKNAKKFKIKKIKAGKDYSPSDFVWMVITVTFSVFIVAAIILKLLERAV